MICKVCQQSFEISDTDTAICRDFEVPLPTRCPDCRHQRRLAWRNERNLYQRTCGKIGKKIISVYSPDKPFTVYSPEAFWSDSWDPLSFGQPIDFNRPFFPQFRELMERVPLLSNTVLNSENSEYNAFVVNSKNCYLCARVGNSQDILYSYLSVNCIGCMDCLNTYHCEQCYECIDCWKCYNSQNLQLCKEVSDSAWCFDCTGCRNCFGCVGLRNAEYHVFNTRVSPEEYDNFLKSYRSSSSPALEELTKKFSAITQAAPHRAVANTNAEAAIGDFVTRSKNIFRGFDIEESESCRYAWGVEFSKDIYDANFIYYGERCYEQISNARSTNIRFSFGAYDSSNLTYCMMCFSGSKDCFGCISLKKNEYCILNKAYPKDEYLKLSERLTEHMQKIGEWGQFPDAKFSPFAYNESVAQDFFSLERTEALARGLCWKDEDEREYKKQLYTVPWDVAAVPDAITSEVLACAKCRKNFKIAPQELAFYRKHHLHIPAQCHTCRHSSRVAKRNPKLLWERKCAQCGRLIQSGYSPQRPERVFCEQCYLKVIY